MEDLTGRKFGELTPLVVLSKGHNGANWLCKCDCGSLTTVASCTMMRRQTNKRVTSCGCAHKEVFLKNLAGLRIGRLLVIRRVEDAVYPSSNSKPHVQWLCRCDCGNETTVRAMCLNNQTTRSCGCLVYENKGRREVLTDVQRLMNKYRSAAKRRGHTWGLSENRFAELISDNCYYCGAPPNKTSRDIGKLKYNGVDRKDSDNGYLDENCVTCCRFCNFRKSDVKYEDFVSWILRVARNIEGKTIGKCADRESSGDNWQPNFLQGSSSCYAGNIADLQV